MQLISHEEKVDCPTPHLHQLLTDDRKSSNPIVSHVICTKCTSIYFANNFVMTSIGSQVNFLIISWWWKFLRQIFLMFFHLIKRFFILFLCITLILCFIKNDWWTCLQNLFSVLAFYQIEKIYFGFVCDKMRWTEFFLAIWSTLEWTGYHGAILHPILYNV